MKVDRLSLSSITASAASRRCGSTRSDGRVAVLAGARLRRICDADCTRRCGIANAGAPMGAGDQEPSGAGPRSAGSWVWGGALGYGFAGEAVAPECAPTGAGRVMPRPAAGLAIGRASGRERVWQYE